LAAGDGFVQQHRCVVVVVDELLECLFPVTDAEPEQYPVAFVESFGPGEEQVEDIHPQLVRDLRHRPSELTHTMAHDDTRWHTTAPVRRVNTTCASKNSSRSVVSTSIVTSPSASETAPHLNEKSR